MLGRFSYLQGYPTLTGDTLSPQTRQDARQQGYPRPGVYQSTLGAGAYGSHKEHAL